VPCQSTSGSTSRTAERICMQENCGLDAHSCVCLQVKGKREVYELLCILDFNNVRKRMSVILRREGKLRLYCKGADNVIYARLKSGNHEIRSKTQEHLNVSRP